MEAAIKPNPLKEGGGGVEKGREQALDMKG